MSLRDEVRDFHAAQADLTKWKFLLVGTLTAIGLGFVEHAPKGSVLALALVPLLALYADCLHVDYDMKIFLIAAYAKSTDADDYSECRQYEAFVEQLVGKGVWWWLVGWGANFGASLLVSLAVLIAGLLVADTQSPASNGPSAIALVSTSAVLLDSLTPRVQGRILFVSGVFGCMSQIALQFWYQVVYRRIMR